MQSSNLQILIFTTLILFVSSNNTCPNLELQTNPPLNLTEYIRSTWYIQQQQINGYQNLSDLYCVTATYNIDNNSHVPFFKGTTISVYNYANMNKVNGVSMGNNSHLCGRQPNSSEPEKLLVAPCFLPNLFGGPYWIVLAGPNSSKYEWAVVSGGQPSVRVTNNTCTTKETGVNNSGLWIFSRNKTLNNDALLFIHKDMKHKGLDTSKLYNVSQIGCRYDGSFIKS
jgi:apolipoprotein D and lipocalin family protein